MHREVQMKHDLMNRECKYTLMAYRHETSGLCEKNKHYFLLCMLLEVVTINLHFMTDRQERFDLKISKLKLLRKQR